MSTTLTICASHLSRGIRAGRRSIGILLAFGSVASVIASPQAKLPAPQGMHHWYQIGSATWYGEAFLGKAAVRVEQVRADDPELTHTLGEGFSPSGAPLGTAN